MVSLPGRVFLSLQTCHGSAKEAPADVDVKDVDVSVHRATYLGSRKARVLCLNSGLPPSVRAGLIRSEPTPPYVVDMAGPLLLLFF